jgi:hopanoid biosynthesis associated protein HpnK
MAMTEPARRQRRLIITADDYGLSPAINEAVEAAHREGILSAASLMVGAPAAADAVARARRLPRLRVGLHLVLVDGWPSLPPEQVAGLADGSGRFPSAMLLPSVRLFLRPTLRRQARAEIRAQFAAFRATGLPLDHVNTHKHLHLHPTVLGLILEIGREFGMRAVRVPREPLPRRGGLISWVQQVSWRTFLWPWMLLLRGRLRDAGIRHNDHIFGVSQSGCMDETALLAAIAAMPSGTTEIYLHPSAGGAGSPGSADELRALSSAAARRALSERNLVPIGFRDLIEDSSDSPTPAKEHAHAT